MVYSFDIFDTLITRTTATPRGIFAVMQKKIREDKAYGGLPEFVKKYFFRIRVNAEKEARETNRLKKGTTEVTFDDIYDLLQYMHGLSDREREDLKRLELHTEKTNCVPVWDNIRRVREYKRNADNRIFLISDMYHSQRTIREWLVQFDSCFSDIPVLVSCEHGKTKESGALFELFIRRYEIVPADWIHIGDNRISDGIQVELQGGGTELFSVPLYSPFELSVINNNEDQAAVQLTLGAVKNSTAKDGGYEIGRRAAGPVLYGYCLWVLECAQRLNISNLYYIARDGYVLKMISDLIINEKHWNIKTHYLYGSRKAWQLPAMAGNREKLKTWFAHKCCFYGIDDLCEAVDMDREKLFLYLPDVVPDKATVFSKAERTSIRKSLLENDAFLQALDEIAENKTKSAAGYLRQEIDGSEEAAFVELNGTGYTQQCLGDLLELSGRKVVSFYYTMAGVLDFSPDKNIFYKYTYERFAIDDILEPLCRAPYGETTGYRYEDKKWAPVLDECGVDYPSKDDYQYYAEGIGEFVRVMAANEGCDGIDLHDVAAAYVRHICQSPEEEVLSFIGDMPFTSQSGRQGDEEAPDKSCRRFAPHLSEDELKRIYLYGDSEWFERDYSPRSRRYMQLRLTAHDKELIALYSKMRARRR